MSILLKEWSSTSSTCLLDKLSRPIMDKLMKRAHEQSLIQVNNYLASCIEFLNV